MLILPAIDLRGGKCVRLAQGDYARETVFGEDPVGMARRCVGEGAPVVPALRDVRGEDREAAHVEPVEGVVEHGDRAVRVHRDERKGRLDLSWM